MDYPWADSGGTHQGLVERGGFVRSLMGLEDNEWEDMQGVERANLISYNVMGPERYLRLVRQRSARFQSVDTDVNVENDVDMEQAEEEEPDDDP